ncbi:uncharacterized protein B0J16DRAFT_394731 [Fusarium flagelliforme]|uniref:uncharacterized protein n=1 Tax=Fusarium flagelliforme TaxID=2675880 RepID=UPI001E8CE8E6|nr:uncharacterized protein B0J16DRAFT_394731 [Fusarium flagelliforme]KAH7192771.1 hypothetical protein B0J16DRAFT_394731 [Fusarium flagelliforme]
MSQPKAYEPRLAPSMAQLVPDHEAVWDQKIRWTIAEVQQRKSEGKKALILVRQKHRAIAIQDALVNNGIVSTELSTSTERNQETAIQRFRESGSNLDALIVTYTPSQNVSLAGACKHGLIVQYPEEFQEYVEATNSLTTTDQTTKPSWNAAFVRGTMDVVTETRLIRSGVDFVLTNMGAPRWLTDQQNTIRACYFVAMIMGHSCSGYPRLRVHWSRLETVEVRREGLFYFALGKLLEEQPEISAQVTGENISRTALSWVPGTDLTAEHVMGAHPEAADGVILFNYVVGGHRAGML